MGDIRLQDTPIVVTNVYVPRWFVLVMSVDAKGQDVGVTYLPLSVEA